MSKRKLTAEDVAAIREAWDTGKVKSVEALGAKYGVSVSTIAAIVKRLTWRDLAQKLEQDDKAA
jgi:ribosomal protein S25